MLKKRIIAKLLIKNDICVQSMGFGRYKPLGKPEVAIAHFNAWGVDEIACLHIDNAGVMDVSYLDKVASYASYCQVPLSVGGGIGSVENAQKALYYGADKVVINSLLHESPEIIYKAAKKFGKQSLVISIDIKKEQNQFIVYTHGGKASVDLPLADTVRLAEDSGAGEILISSIDREGSGEGYALDALLEIRDLVSIPILVGGGYGKPVDIKSVFKAGASGACIGNALHFSEHSVALIKGLLQEEGTDIRYDSPLKYEEGQVDVWGRVRKVGEPDLLQLRFKKNVLVDV